MNSQTRLGLFVIPGLTGTGVAGSILSIGRRATYNKPHFSSHNIDRYRISFSNNSPFKQLGQIFFQSRDIFSSSVGDTITCSAFLTTTFLIVTLSSIPTPILLLE
ncbi:MAG: hypothetical protein M3146_09470 [Thermoproteota archaeon]|nr:hypothetical protein [Thermoproteota archaeon]